MTFKPYWYQEEALVQTNQWFRTNKTGNPCVVIPTGGGKSVVIAETIKQYLTKWPKTRIIVLAHVKELIRQNYEKTTRHWPDAPLGTFGIYSAGLNQRDTESRVIFAGIQSVAKRAFQLGRFDLIFVDEAHRIRLEDEGQYRLFIEECRKANPGVRIIGYTATPYRAKGGMIIGEDYILNDISYEVGVRTLIDQGYLCNLVSKGSSDNYAEHLNERLDKVSVRGGDYVESELNNAFDREILNEAINEIIYLAQDRKSWVVFCAGVESAEMTTDMLKSKGIETRLITGATPKEERDQATEDFKNGKYRALVNINVFSEGFDSQNVDCIIGLRPTKSPGLWYQQIGRGLRIHPNKENCLVLDFSGNTERLGPIDALRLPKNGLADGNKGEAPAKKCPECLEIVHAQAMVCPACNYEWPKIKHDMTASNANVLSAPQTHNVTSIFYFSHTPRRENAVTSLRVDYFSSNFNKICSEYICLQHDGYARKKAEKWWALHTGWHPDETPYDVASALEYIEKHGIKQPVGIETKKREKDSKFVDVTRYIFEWAEDDDKIQDLPWMEDGDDWEKDEITDAEIPF